MKRLFFLAVMTAVSFGAFADLKYIEIESVINVPIIQVKSADGFEGILKANKIRTAYIQKESGTLFVIADNTYFSFMLNGYDSFEDYKKGSSRSFKNGADYNEAKLLALSDSSEVYYFYKRNEFKSVEDCRDAYKNGFCFIKEERNAGEQEKKPLSLADRIDLERRNNQAAKKTVESDNYYKAKELGYTNISQYNDYVDCMAKGFKTSSDMMAAIVQGFPVPTENLAENGTVNWSKANRLLPDGKPGDDFYRSRENGFHSYAEFSAARERGISSFADFENYRTATQFCDNLVKTQGITKLQALIWYRIKQLNQSELSLTVLSKTLEDDFAKESAQLQNALKWYVNDVKNRFEFDQKQKDQRGQRVVLSEISRAFTAENLKNFFSTVDISPLGSYSATTEIFKRK